MEELFREIESAYQEQSARDLSEELKLSVFRGFLLATIAQSYGFEDWDAFMDAHKGD